MTPDTPHDPPHQSATQSAAASLRPLLGAGIVLIVGSLAPWVSFLGLASASGLTVGFGWMTLLAGATVLAIALDPAWLQRGGWLNTGTRRRRTLRTLAIVSIIDCVLVILGAPRSQYGAAIGPEWGVFLTLAAAITVLVSSRKPAPHKTP